MDRTQLWQPSRERIARSQIRRYQDWLARTAGVETSDYADLHAWRRTTVEKAEADYGRIFITSSASSEIRQSEVTLEEALNGLDPSDTRLHDEIVSLLNA